MDPHPETIKVVELNFTSNSSGNHIWTMNDQTYRGNYNNPLLLLANQAQDPNNNSVYDADSLVYNFGSSKTVRIVLNNAYQAWHPMHLHGYHMQVIAEGDGYWDGVTVTNPANPLRRDTHILRRYGHLVIQIEADNPGIWPYHCHIAWHLSAGFNMNILTQPQKIKDAKIPYIMAQTCLDWDRFSSQNVVDQIDAGL
jgi:FtsP/CotA-like multicopper oxidase with cupredoxin domain